MVFKVPVQNTLAEALAANLDRVTVIGKTKDGKLFASASCSTPEVQQDLATFEKYLDGDESVLADPGPGA